LRSIKEGEKSKTRIQIQTEISRREYAQESDEVKTKVEEYRNNLMDEQGAAKDQKYQQ
jgi:hypothetical protein